MKVEYINPFIESSMEIIAQTTGMVPTLGKVYVKSIPYKSSTVLVIIGLTGSIHGNVLISLEPDASCRIASAMMGGMEVPALDELAKSAIGELCNMILGRTAVMFSERNITIDITPPTVVTGENIQLSIHKSTTISIPILLDDQSKIEIDISFTEKNKAE